VVGLLDSAPSMDEPPEDEADDDSPCVAGF
jgi:hypothetical protein